MTRRGIFLNKLILFLFGGVSYLLIEMLWRGYSHWSMFILGGVCFLLIGLINEYFPSDIPLLPQAVLGSFIITLFEFCAGCVLNLYLKLDVWDYYDMPYNILGQICLPYSVLWLFLSIVCVIADDYIRYLFMNGEKPKYKLV